MKKKTIIIVSISVVLALLAISVIATFPTYLFDDSANLGENILYEDIQSNSVTESEKGEDVGNVGATPNGGIPSDLPGEDDNNQEDSTALNEYYKVESNDGVTIKALKGSMKDYTVSIDKLGKLDKDFYLVRSYVRSFSKRWQIFDITCEKDGKTAEPTGLAKAVFGIPKKYDTDKVAVYRVLSDGLLKLNCEINESDRTATVNFSQPGIYILVELKEADKKPSSSTTSSTPSSSEDTSSNTSSNESSTPSSGNESTDSSSDSSSTESEDSSSSTPEVDPNKDSMEGWTPWY